MSFSIANEEHGEIALLKSKPVSRKYEHGCSHINLNSMMTRIGVRIGDCDIEPNPCARNIGVFFDSSMNMNDQSTNNKVM